MSQEGGRRYINNRTGSIGFPKSGLKGSPTRITEEGHIGRKGEEQGFEGARSVPVCLIDS